jgi:stringent starvation protein B
MTMTSSVPYLLRAINEWILDNDLTPYLILDATVADTQVPLNYVKDDQIVLNISPSAIRDLMIEDGHLTFSGRFGGVSHYIHAPMRAVLGIVAKENGEGMWFHREDKDPEPTPPKAIKKGPPALKVIM